MVIVSRRLYILARKPVELPPAVARFVRDMRPFFAAAHDSIKADAIVASRLRSLKRHYPGKLKR
jgi:hypothetical protein